MNQNTVLRSRVTGALLPHMTPNSGCRPKHPPISVNTASTGPIARTQQITATVLSIISPLRTLNRRPNRLHNDIPCLHIGKLHDQLALPDRKSTRLNSSHLVISYAVF